MGIRDLFRKAVIIPVSVFEDETTALKTAEIFFRHKVDIIEVTLRTERSFDCIAAIRKEFPEILVGAGSVLDNSGLRNAANSGAGFAVAPCLDESVVRYAAELGVPFVPGVATPTELNNALKFSDIIKIFPAGPLGGPPYINSITAPFRMIDFNIIPTGGIDSRNFREYLDCEKVLACGLTYPVAERLLRERDFLTVEKRIMELFGEV